MAQLNIKLPDEEMEALRRYAARQRTPVAWLIKDYVQFLLEGGQPLRPNGADASPPMELAALAERGGAFDWLADEPDLYSPEDATPV